MVGCCATPWRLRRRRRNFDVERHERHVDDVRLGAADDPPAPIPYYPADVAFTRDARSTSAEAVEAVHQRLQGRAEQAPADLWPDHEGGIEPVMPTVPTATQHAIDISPDGVEPRV